MQNFTQLARLLADIGYGINTAHGLMHGAPTVPQESRFEGEAELGRPELTPERQEAPVRPSDRSLLLR